MGTNSSDHWIAVAKRAGEVARESAYATGTGARLRRVAFPRPLGAVLAARRDGTLTAAIRAFNYALGGDR